MLPADERANGDLAPVGGGVDAGEEAVDALAASSPTPRGNGVRQRNIEPRVDHVAPWRISHSAIVFVLL